VFNANADTLQKRTVIMQLISKVLPLTPSLICSFCWLLWGSLHGTLERCSRRLWSNEFVRWASEKKQQRQISKT